MNIIFTFKPESLDPKDRLHFVVDTRGYVITRPLNKIVDTAGAVVDMDIESVSRYGELSGPESLMEIWLATGAAKGVFLPKFRDGSRGTVNWSLIVKTIGLGLVAVAAVVGLVYLLGRYSGDSRKERRDVSVKKTVETVAIPRVSETATVPKMIL